jgi:hypothetical protein
LVETSIATIFEGNLERRREASPEYVAVILSPSSGNVVEDADFLQPRDIPVLV